MESNTIMDNNQSSQRKASKLKKSNSTQNKGFFGNSATRKAWNAIDNFENIVRERMRDASKEQIIGASIALALTLVIFFYSLYVGNYLVALIVIAVWGTT